MSLLSTGIGDIENRIKESEASIYTDINQYLILGCIRNPEFFFHQYLLVYILPEERRSESLLKEEGKQLFLTLTPIPL